MAGAQRLLVTGFGPFPGAPENPTERLVRALAEEPAAAFGAAALHAEVLITEYRRSWAALERLYEAFKPDTVVHFGLSERIEALHVEALGRNVVDPTKPDACGDAPASPRIAEDGPETLRSTFPVEAILTALAGAGFAAARSDNAGVYVCNATLYRSLSAAPPERRVGFVHVPADGRGGYDAARLKAAARLVLAAACQAPPEMIRGR